MVLHDAAAAIALQAQRVNEAYAKTNGCNPEYNREFDILSNMRKVSMANQFRDERGLPPDAKTPYDLKPRLTSSADQTHCHSRLEGRKYYLFELDKADATEADYEAGDGPGSYILYTSEGVRHAKADSLEEAEAWIKS